MNEASKAHKRRMREDSDDDFPWKEILTSGPGVDAGCGPDKIPLDNIVGFDLPGDANHLSNYFPPESQSVLHSSQLFEHLHNPRAAFADWMKVLKPGGWMIMTVPEAVLYGDMMWTAGPRFNTDHKSTWSVFIKGSPAPIHIYAPYFVNEMAEQHGLTRHLLRLVDDGYDYSKMWMVDQTFPVDGAECFIEMVWEKK